MKRLKRWLGLIDGEYVVLIPRRGRRWLRWKSAQWRAIMRLRDARHRYAYALGMVAMAEGVAGYLRIRVINRSPLLYFADGFENASGITAATMSYPSGPFLWHSLGTETGTDNSINYWTAASGGAWTFAANIATPPAATADAILLGGHSDWDNTNGGIIHLTRVANCQVGGAIGICVGATGDGYYCILESANNVRAYKRVAGVYTALAAAQSATWAAANVKWLYCALNGTTLTYGMIADSAGTPTGTTNLFTVTDSTFTTGAVSLRANTTVGTATFGGAFAAVCTVRGPLPDGTQGQTWTPVTTTGEPAFAWSKVSPYAGTYTASIQNRNASGNGSWQQTIRLFSGANVTLSGQVKATAGGSAYLTAGGLTTNNGGAAYTALSVSGAITTNPTVSCNYTGVIGTAYFDALSILNPAYEITPDLAHLHTTHIDVNAMQPGNPSSSAIGGFTVNLFPPGSEGFAANKATYDQLDYYQRVEFYISHDGASLGKLYFAGPITAIDKQYGETSSFTLSGAGDTQYANLSRPFPGELSFGQVVSGALDQFKNALAVNEPGVTDAFSPFVSANYTSTNFPTFSAGTWTAATDDSLNVVSCSTGTLAALISKTGAAANDEWHMQMVEAYGRLDINSATGGFRGSLGVGISRTSQNVNDSVVAFIRSKLNGTTLRFDVDVILNVYQSGVLTQTVASSALTSVDDPQLFIPITIQLLCQNDTSGPAGIGVSATVSINGSTVIKQTLTTFDPGTAICYPLLAFGTPTGGTSYGYLTNLVQMTRYSNNLRSDSAFVAGTTSVPASTSTYSLPGNLTLDSLVSPAPTLLEAWTAAATRPGWYWRYTPRPYVLGVRTLGAVDYGADPGTDRGTAKQTMFSRSDGNLVGLQISANADSFATGTQSSSFSGTDNGGQGVWRDTTAMVKYGAIEDQALVAIVPGATGQHRTTFSVVANKVAVNSGGSKTAVVRRDPQTVDKWRELDKVMIHDPEMNLNYSVSRILGYTFDEGQGTQTITLDQFSAEHVSTSIPIRRLQQSVFQIANKFGNRS